MKVRPAPVGNLSRRSHPRPAFAITGTWPMRTEREWSDSEIGTNCARLQHRPRLPPARGRRAYRHAPRVSDRAQGRSCRSRSRICNESNIAPVDLAQAAIGPGWRSIHATRKVLDAAGKPLSVREALALINQTLDEVLAEQEGDFDADRRWALAWFEQSGFCGGGVRRGRDALQGEEHQRRRHGRCRHSRSRSAARCGS